MAETKRTYTNPFLWVPSSYLAMGLIYGTVTGLSKTMFFHMGMGIDGATFWAGVMLWPYILKLLWAPAIELYRTKKFFVLSAQAILVLLVACVAFAVPKAVSPEDFALSALIPVIAVLGVTAIVGATQDIATDGVYVTTLLPADQAKCMGVQSMCWQIGPVLATGVLLRVVGMLHDAPAEWGDSWLVEHVWRPMLGPLAAAAHTTNDWQRSWATVMFVVAAFIGLLALYHVKFLPPGEKAKDAPKDVKDAMRTFGHVFVSFFQKKGIVLMIAFAFFFRFGYGFIEAMSQLFMMADRVDGGLGLKAQLVGDITGTYGTAAFMAGSVPGGLFVARFGLRRTLLVLCLCMNVPNVVYVYFSQAPTQNYALIASLVSIEKFFWGFGAVGLMIYFVQQVAPGPYRTAHLTIGSAIMALNMSFTGMISGTMAKHLGYKTFFLVVLIGASIPSLIATFFAPFHHADTTGPVDEEPPEPAAASG
jgi:PAT family beta-lactamase induction signal transducer AmpG